MLRYSELARLGTLQERFEYAKLSGGVGDRTFGGLRWLNQAFYRSGEWKKVRRDILVRDEGCELGLKDYPIGGRILLHHLNPITAEDIEERPEWVLSPENLICVSEEMHNAIHYGSLELLPRDPVIRLPGDTKLW